MLRAVTSESSCIFCFKVPSPHMFISQWFVENSSNHWSICISVQKNTCFSFQGHLKCLCFLSNPSIFRNVEDLTNIDLIIIRSNIYVSSYMTPRRWTDDFTTVKTGRFWKEGSVSLQMADTEAEAPKKPRDRFFKNGHQIWSNYNDLTRPHCEITT